MERSHLRISAYKLVYLIKPHTYGEMNLYVIFNIPPPKKKIPDPSTCVVIQLHCKQLSEWKPFFLVVMEK